MLRVAALAAGGAVRVAAAGGDAAAAAGGPPPAAAAAAPSTVATAAGGEAVSDAAPLPPAAAYGAYVATYDALEGQSALSRAVGLDDARRAPVARARRHVLELAVGTGRDLFLYGPPLAAAGATGAAGPGGGGDGVGGGGGGGGVGGGGRRPPVTSITGVDVSTGMLAVAARRAAAAPILVSLIAADVTPWLPFPAAAIDTILDTYSLCTFGAPAAALAEAAWLLRPCGAVLLLERFLGASRGGNPNESRVHVVDGHPQALRPRGRGG